MEERRIPAPCSRLLGAADNTFHTCPHIQTVDLINSEAGGAICCDLDQAIVSAKESDKDRCLRNLMRFLFGAGT